MDTSDIRKGVKIVMDGQPYAVADFQFVKPGKGQAFTRCRLKNMQTGAVLEKTFKSGEKLEKADVEEKNMQFIYPDGDEGYVFMDEETGEQITIAKAKMEDEAKWISDGMSVAVTVFQGEPIGVELPSHVILQITESDPGLKGDTASGATKPATVSTGATVNVPLFISEGEWIKIDPRTGSYLERVNKKD